MAESRLPPVITGPLPLSESGPAALSGLEPYRRKPRPMLNLFWRTFFLLAALMGVSTFAWLQSFRALEYEPLAVQTAQQITSLVSLSQAALKHNDAIARVVLIKTLFEHESVRIEPRGRGDVYENLNNNPLDQRVAKELRHRLGPGTVVARSVNQQPGLWVSFTIDNDMYWLLMDPARFGPILTRRAWFIWIAAATAISLIGAALVAGLINRPLRKLFFAASRLRIGDFDANRLDEYAATSEIREVNKGFNRMASKLAKVEQDRAVMLAGISHDLRTPLARLRLEAEMSVADPQARAHMVADIGQLDAIIDKFLDYARPDQVALEPVDLAQVVQTCMYPFQSSPDIRITHDLPHGLMVMADPVELGRVLANLLENARRYGKTAQTGVAEVCIAADENGPWAALSIRDQGSGVSEEALAQLTKPFYRGDAARTSAIGAGLGLAIAEKTIVRMGGALKLSNHPKGGLVAFMRLVRAK